MSYKIALVGEAWGEQEEILRQPFVGPAGYQLTQLLNEANIARADCFITNVFNLRPEKNDVESLCVPKSEDRSGLPPLRNGKYLDARYLPELDRLHKELRGASANVTVALGGTAAWALLGDGRISKIRGTVAGSDYSDGRKILPTYHPSAILRQWDLRPVTILDLRKAKRESEFPDIRRPERTVYIEPDLSDMEWFFNEHLLHAKRISIDIETAGHQITCIGFAPTPQVAMVVPFHDPRAVGSGNSYWPSLDIELAAWAYVRRVCALPCTKVFQNGMYDLTFLWRSYGIPVNNASEDTMLAHHSLQPESEKGLAFLGSVYTNESSWKLMRSRGKTTIKRED